MIKEISVSTSKRADFVEITADVSKAISSSGIKEGTALIYVPHTTAGITINENVKLFRGTTVTATARVTPPPT